MILYRIVVLFLFLNPVVFIALGLVSLISGRNMFSFLWNDERDTE